MPEQQPSDVLALLNTACRDAGWLFSIDIQETQWGSRIAIDSMPLEQAQDLALAIAAGNDARVIRK